MNVLQSPERLRPLQNLGLMEGKKDHAFELISNLARQAIEAPIVLVSLVTDACQVFPSMLGIPEEDLPERCTPLSLSFCKHVVAEGKALIVEDARIHPLVKDNPAVTELNVIAYLGFPIRSKENHVLGSFCVIDLKPRVWTPKEITLVRDFAEVASTEIKLREEILHDKLLQEELRREKEEIIRLKDRAERLAQEATHANQAKSAFLANMSHEIRTPMNGVVGLTELLSETPLDEEQRRLVETVKMSGESLLELINDILDYSKLEAGKVSFEYMEVDIRRLVNESVQLLDVIARKKGLRIQAEIDSCVPAIVVTDPHRLRQVVLNLLSNAVKFTQRGKVRIEAGLFSPTSDDQSRYLEIRVADSGIGIPPQKIPQLFNAFTQVDRSTARKYGGTGLGLAICAHIVKGLGGNVQVNSTLGKGSVFRIQLPFLERVNDRKKSGQEKGLGPAGGELPTNWKVLLVEDQPVNQMVASMMLKRLGFDHDIASNGEEALSCLAAAAYDVVLMDMQMPVLNGYEATEAIRASDKPWAGIPIVAMTAHALKGAREECLAHGMNDYIAKPISLSQLKAVFLRLGETCDKKKSS